MYLFQRFCRLKEIPRYLLLHCHENAYPQYMLSFYLQRL
ncbi:hypothetical protein C1O63_0515 [Dehalococcoides mccartyi]|nr:hypothetical protein C1O63_0515 [Dehalococcoides mccartyi]